MKLLGATGLTLIGPAVALMAAQSPAALPPDLAALGAKARLEATVVAWCRAEFRAGQRGAFAAAVSSTGVGGRYVALDSDGRTTELASYKGRADLSCYTRGEAEKLNRSILQSRTIDGELQPRWNVTVVCGFIDDTTVECWQYFAAERRFVRVGHWST